MSPEQILAMVQQILSGKPIEMPAPMSLHEETDEKLIRIVVLFLSMENAGLRNTILAVAQYRLVQAAAAGKKPWETWR